MVASSAHGVPLASRGVWGTDKENDVHLSDKTAAPKTKVVRTWYGKKKVIPIVSQGDIENLGPEKRPQKLYAPLYNGLAAGMSIVVRGQLWIGTSLGLTRIPSSLAMVSVSV